MPAKPARRLVLLSAAALALLVARTAHADVIVYQNGFASGDTCAWTSTEPPVTCDPDMVFVPAGDFTMGSNESADEIPAHTVTLDAFWIDKNDVTVDAYGACVTAAGCAEANGAGGDCNRGVVGRGDHPINCVDWSRAQAYCTWVGKRLPTEAEWEKAARGEKPQTYTWGEATPLCDYAVLYDASGPGCGLSSTWPVGSKPPGQTPYGAFDMAGNVFTWVSDWYAADYYASSPSTNPPGPVTGTAKVVRGFAWDYGASFYLRTSYRESAGPTLSSYRWGIRCAKNG